MAPPDLSCNMSHVTHIFGVALARCNVPTPSKGLHLRSTSVIVAVRCVTSLQQAVAENAAFQGAAVWTLPVITMPEIERQDVLGIELAWAFTDGQAS